jgi:hypothetical protein
MGATVWMYFTDYDEDPDRALHRLRDEVFREGRYRRPWEFPDFFSSVGQVPNLSWRARLGFWVMESLFTTIELVRWAFWGFRSPATLQQAVEWAGEDGTHSILDVERTGMVRAFGVAIPLSELRLREAFGTLQPTREAVEEAACEVSAWLARWEAFYFPVCDADGTRHLAFVGVSGD